MERNSFSQLANKNSTQQEASRTNLAVVLPAALLVSNNKVAHVVVLVVSVAELAAKCTKLLAAVVAKKQKCLSVHLATSQFTARTASNQEADTKSVMRTPRAKALGVFCCYSNVTCRCLLPPRCERSSMVTEVDTSSVLTFHFTLATPF